MNYSGGIALFFHLLINTYFNFIKKYPVRALSLITVVAVASIIVMSGKASVVNSLKKNNAEMIKGAMHICNPVNQADSERKLVLRLDDVQAFAYGEITARIIEDAVDHDMKMTLGVIPNRFLEDKEIDKAIDRNRCNLELALHGWDHLSSQEEDVFEFEMAGENEAAEKIREGKRILEQVGGKPVMTFIPPGNKISKETKQVLADEGIPYLSGDNTHSEFGMSATTFDFPNNKLIDNEEILARCEERFAEGEICVIVVHPQDYLTDEEIDEGKYQNFINLLNELRGRGVFATTFSELQFE